MSLTTNQETIRFNNPGYFSSLVKEPRLEEPSAEKDKRASVALSVGAVACAGLGAAELKTGLSRDLVGITMNGIHNYGDTLIHGLRAYSLYVKHDILKSHRSRLAATGIMAATAISSALAGGDKLLDIIQDPSQLRDLSNQPVEFGSMDSLVGNSAIAVGLSKATKDTNMHAETAYHSKSDAKEAAQNVFFDFNPTTQLISSFNTVRWGIKSTKLMHEGVVACGHDHSDESCCDGGENGAMDEIGPKWINHEDNGQHSHCQHHNHVPVQKIEEYREESEPNKSRLADRIRSAYQNYSTGLLGLAIEDKHKKTVQKTKQTYRKIKNTQQLKAVKKGAKAIARSYNKKIKPIKDTAWKSAFWAREKASNLAKEHLRMNDKSITFLGWTALAGSSSAYLAYRFGAIDTFSSPRVDSDLAMNPNSTTAFSEFKIPDAGSFGLELTPNTTNPPEGLLNKAPDARMSFEAITSDIIEPIETGASPQTDIEPPVDSQEFSEPSSETSAQPKNPYFMEQIPLPEQAYSIEYLQPYDPLTGDGTIWSIGKNKLIELGVNEPTNSQIYKITDIILRENNMSWDQAKSLQTGYEIKVPNNNRLLEFI